MESCIMGVNVTELTEVKKVTLSPFWVLTTDHSASSYGRPVLVNTLTGEAFGPGDIIQAYPDWEWEPARDAVIKMAKIGTFTKEEMDFINKF